MIGGLLIVGGSKLNRLYGDLSISNLVQLVFNKVNALLTYPFYIIEILRLVEWGVGFFSKLLSLGGCSLNVNRW